RERVEPDEVDAASLDPHPGRERDAGHDHADDQPANEPTDCVAGDDPAPPCRGEQEPPRKPVLEVARDSEAGEDAAERGRLEQDEAELETGVPWPVVEAGHVPQA